MSYPVNTLSDSFPYGLSPRAPKPVVAQRAPASTDLGYDAGTVWCDQVGAAAYVNVKNSGGTADWEVIGGGSFAVSQLTGDSGTAIPSAGSIKIAGTANQITTAGSGATITLSLPSAITVPGSLTATTSLSSTTSITAGTTLTATLGNITATNGNIVKGTAGNKDVYNSVASNTTAGANSAGSVTLVGGTATINTTSVTASSLIRISRQGIGSTGAAALGILTIGTITDGTSFVINSVQAANATALQASDVSVIFWEIVN